MSISKPFHIVSMFIHSPALYRLLDLNECTGLPSSLLSLKFRLPFFQCVKNLARQGFPSSTCPIGRCCVCSPLLFGSEIHLYFVIRQHTVNRGWIKWAQVGGPVAWKPKMHDDIMLNGVFSLFCGLLLGNWIPNLWKDLWPKWNRTLLVILAWSARATKSETS